MARATVGIMMMHKRQSTCQARERSCRRDEQHPDEQAEDDRGKPCEYIDHKAHDIRQPSAAKLGE